MRYLGLFNLKKKRLKVDLITVYIYLNCGSQVDGAWLFSLTFIDKTRDSGSELEHGKLHTNMRKSLFTVRVNTGTCFPER